MADVAVQKTDSFWDQVRGIEERVMRRAYDIFRDSGSSLGQDLDHWLAAERELVRKPPIEMTEKDNRFEIKIAVTGIDPKELKVEVTADALLVKGETKTEKTEKTEAKGQIHTSELQTGSLFRSIQFPKKIDAGKVKADQKNGLLTVTAEIAEEEKAQKVNVQTAG